MVGYVIRITQLQKKFVHNLVSLEKYWINIWFTVFVRCILAILCQRKHFNSWESMFMENKNLLVSGDINKLVAKKQSFFYNKYMWINHFFVTSTNVKFMGKGDPQNSWTLIFRRQWRFYSPCWYVYYVICLLVCLLCYSLVGMFTSYSLGFRCPRAVCPLGIFLSTRGLYREGVGVWRWHWLWGQVRWDQL